MCPDDRRVSVHGNFRIEIGMCVFRSQFVCLQFKFWDLNQLMATLKVNANEHAFTLEAKSRVVVALHDAQ